MNKRGSVAWLSMVVAIACSVVNVFGAHGVLKIRGVDHTLRTGTTGGQCVETDLGDKGTDLDCRDGDHRAVANSTTGCGFVEGSALCASGTEVPSNLHASLELNCEGGSRYVVSTGDDRSLCSVSISGTDKIAFCKSGAETGKHGSALANCSKGCVETRGAGCCCQIGTAGCGAGRHCTGG